MLPSAVVDPGAFDKEHFEDPTYRLNAEDLLRGFMSNGILVVDEEEELLRALEERIRNLEAKQGQQLRIRLEELLKRRRARVANIAIAKSEMDEDPGLLAEAVCRKANPDSMVAGGPSFTFRCGPAIDLSLGITGLDTFRESRFEQMRRYYMEEMEALNEMPRPEVDIAFRRILKYASEVTIFDKQLCKAAIPPDTRKNLSNFLSTFNFIGKIWRNYGKFANSSDAKLTIVSAEPWLGTAERSQRVLRPSLLRLKREFLEPLNDGRFPFPVEAIIKMGYQNKDFHARYLQTQAGAFSVDPGFDFLLPTKQFKHTKMLIENRAQNLLLRIRGFPDSKEWEQISLGDT